MAWMFRSSGSSSDMNFAASRSISRSRVTSTVSAAFSARPGKLKLTRPDCADALAGSSSSTAAALTAMLMILFLMRSPRIRRSDPYLAASSRGLMTASRATLVFSLAILRASSTS